MNLKKIVAIMDHFPNCASPRKKVVSRFGLGFISVFIILFILFSNFYFKNPNSDKLFYQGYDVSNNNSSLIAWSLSFSRTSIFIENNTQLEQKPKINLVSESRAKSNGSNEDISLKYLGIDEKGNTHFGNSTGDGKNGCFNGVSAKGVDFKDTQLIKVKNDVKNGTFSAITVNPSEGKVSIGQEIVNVSAKSDGLDAKLDSRNKSDRIKISQNLGNFGSAFEECDIFDGRWVRDDTKPYYPAGSCPFVDKDFNCHLNKRPDSKFLKWRWQPFGCEIPSMNATDFLERLRGKKMVFVGDSLNRNMWESLVCILRNSLKNKKRVYEVSGKSEFKKKGIYAFRFEDYNCTVDFVSSPFLVRESSFKGINGSFETLRLDLMDRTTSMYQDADILIFNTGHWWTHEKTSRGEDYYQEGNHVYPRLKALDAYTRALSTWAKWVDKNIDSRKTQVIFRGYSVTHFWGGQWNSGGQCHKETEPIFNTSHLTRYPSKMRALDNVMRVMKTPVIYLNISRLTDYRKDGHPSIYRTKYNILKEQNSTEHAQDCSHWCLPGVPDSWNELLYASLLKIGKGTWRS
ncbi:protein trichome birefringence-like 2 [Rutidosis leptorrhynchoides]|uniref:protein trichome birefringence-like 2 n=1 Tax=Rutidosis leptorrhynchoides TaxID=125765 RepID=UPI003A99489B